MKKKKSVVLLVPPEEERAKAQDAADVEDTFSTAREIELALREKGYTVKQDSLTSLYSMRQDRKISEVFFNLCEQVRGKNEAEAYVAALLEFYGVPYTGSPPESLLVCLHKERTKQILRAQGLSTPRGCLAEARDRPAPYDGHYPAIVKPAHEDGSVGISLESVVSNDEELTRQLKVLTSQGKSPILVEEFIKGPEINAAILGDQILPFSQIEYAEDLPPLKRICSFNAKWVPDSAEYKTSPAVCPPTTVLDVKQKDELTQLAQKAFTLLRCRDYARVDFRLDEEGNPFILEVNPNPCLASDAGFALSAQAAGIKYEDLIEKIVQFAIERAKHG